MLSLEYLAQMENLIDEWEGLEYSLSSMDIDALLGRIESNILNQIARLRNETDKFLLKYLGNNKWGDFVICERDWFWCYFAHLIFESNLIDVYSQDKAAGTYSRADTRKFFLSLTLFVSSILRLIESEQVEDNTTIESNFLRIQLLAFVNLPDERVCSLASWRYG